jgi:hypothetical protein
MLLLTAPFALIPYVPALFVWLSASWYAFYRALKLAMPGRGLLLLPLVAAALAHLTGIVFGPLFILPLFIVALQMSFGAAARPSARHHRGYHQHNHNRAHHHQGQRVGEHVPDHGEARAFRQQGHAAMRALAGTGLAHVLVHRAGVDLFAVLRGAHAQASSRRRRSSYSALSISPRAKRSFRISSEPLWPRRRPRIMKNIMNTQAPIIRMKNTGMKYIHGPGP